MAATCTLPTRQHQHSWELRAWGAESMTVLYEPHGCQGHSCHNRCQAKDWWQDHSCDAERAGGYTAFSGQRVARSRHIFHAGEPGRQVHPWKLKTASIHVHQVGSSSSLWLSYSSSGWQSQGILKQMHMHMHTISSVHHAPEASKKMDFSLGKASESAATMRTHTKFGLQHAEGLSSLPVDRL